MDLADLQPVLDRLRKRPDEPLRPDRVYASELRASVDRLRTATPGGWLASLLHLWNDDLDRSHDHSQHLHDPLGSHLHGVMHRREGDFSNARFWFRKCADHPTLAHTAARLEHAPASVRTGRFDGLLRRSVLNAAEFTDACEREPEAAELRWIQRQEFEAMLECILESSAT